MKTEGVRSVVWSLSGAAMLLGLPLLGVWLTGHDPRDYAEFPPLTRYVEHAAFSWWFFILMASGILAVMLPFVIKIALCWRTTQKALPPTHRFPWWGWCGLVFGAVAWILAWTRFAWFAPLQAFTFSPLWLAFIITVNAMTFRRTGHCAMVDRPGFFSVLFPVSAVFWWFFEYLNRFVQNWVYEGVEALSATDYVVFATLPFATVLPAVFGVVELLRTYPRITAGLDRFVILQTARPRLLAGAVLLLSGVGLAGIGIWSDYLYPLLWVSPLLLIVCIQALRGRATLCASLPQGDWQEIFRWALAALICGFFWEMWNIASLARWVYNVPLVGRFRIFEMPILGYAGYLPFGLQCAVITIAVDRWCAKGRIPWILRQPLLRTVMALVVAAALWLPCLHFFYKPNLAAYRTEEGMPPRAAAIAARHLDLWSTPEARQHEIAKMRGSNAEWDFMARTYFVLALANMSLREPSFKEEALAVMDTIIDETIRLENEKGMYFFLMDYATYSRFLSQSGRSIFLDGEIALMLGARRLVEEKEQYRIWMHERLRVMEQQLRESPLLIAESYPDECWMFCNAIAMVAFRMSEALDGADYSDLLQGWLQSIKENLTDPETGILHSSFSLSGYPQDGPEGTSIWMVAHCLQLIDPVYATDQYARARRELGRVLFGFGWAREWPVSWHGIPDIDSGPIVPLLEISAGSSGLALVGAAAFDDKPFLGALLASLNYGGFPVKRDGRLHYNASNAVGDAVMLYAMVEGPLWQAVLDRINTREVAE
jgi:hypothetical membrane protein